MAMTAFIWYVLIGCATFGIGIALDEKNVSADGKHGLFWIIGASMWPIFLTVWLFVIITLAMKRWLR